MFTTRANFYHAGTLGLYDLLYDIIFLGELKKKHPVIIIKYVFVAFQRIVTHCLNYRLHLIIL